MDNERNPVSPGRGVTKLRLRPHHVYCTTAFTGSPEARGARYDAVADNIRRVLESEPDAVVELLQGVDELCQPCPLRVGDRCESPNGNENKVRKWDALVLAGLGFHSGDILTVRDIQDRLKARGTLDLCRRCQWGSACSRGPRPKEPL